MVVTDVSRIHPQITPINFRTVSCYLNLEKNLRNRRNLRMGFSYLCVSLNGKSISGKLQCPTF